MKRIFLSLLIVLSSAACQTTTDIAKPEIPPPPKAEPVQQQEEPPTPSPEVIETIAISGGRSSYPPSGFGQTTQENPVLPPPLPPEPAKWPLSVHTDPPGGTIEILEIGEKIADGRSIELEAGVYTFVGTKKGYDRTERIVSLAKGFPESLVVNLGPGYGTLVVKSTPVARISINGIPLPKGMATKKLKPGRYSIKAELAGYFALKKKVDIGPGDNKTLDFALKPLPTSAALHIEADREGASASMDESSIGTLPVDIAALPFGKHRISAINALTPVDRLVGTKEIDFSSTFGDVLRVPLDRKERMFEGRWYSEREALALEEAHYRTERSKTKPTVQFRAEIAPERGDVWREAGISDLLHESMRIGDRIEIAMGDGRWLLWKRNQKPSYEFLTVFSALAAGKAPITLPWKAEKADLAGKYQFGKDGVFGLVAAFKSLRHPVPLAYLRNWQISGSGLTIDHRVDDGDIVFVVDGGSAISLVGKEMRGISGIHLGTVKAANGPSRVTWKTRPRRLIALGTGAQIAEVKDIDAPLQRGEKRSLRLVANDQQVVSLSRFSKGPEFADGKIETFRVNPLAPVPVNLQFDEIGPHGISGQYFRAWLLTVASNDGRTQRYVEMPYAVGEEEKNYGSGKFYGKASTGRGIVNTLLGNGDGE